LDLTLDYKIDSKGRKFCCAHYEQNYESSQIEEQSKIGFMEISKIDWNHIREFY